MAAAARLRVTALAVATQDHGVETGSQRTSSMAKVIAKSAVGDEPDELRYWATVPMVDRIAAVEVLRRRVFGGTDAARLGLQRVCRITRRP